MSSFKTELMKQIDANPKLAKSKLGKSLNAVKDHDDGPFAKLAWQIMENRAKKKLGYDASDKVDWANVSAVDWGKLMEMLMAILPLILKLFGL